MSETKVTVYVSGSGSPISFAPEETGTAKWPVRSSLLSAVVSMLPTVMVTSKRETVHLTRSHQRIMHRAVRRTFKMID